MRTLGATGLPVSAIGLGLAALGRPGYINLGHAADVGDTTVDAMEARAHAVLDAAYEGGVRYFDAARSYGRGEAFLASWLERRGLSAAEVTVGSKWGYTYTADWRVDVEAHEVKDLSADNLRRQLRETRQLLGDRLCLYQIHSATVESGVLEDAAVRDELARLRDEGVFIGLTTTGVHQSDTIERALEVGGFDTVQATWNLHDRSAGPVLAAASEAGLGVIVKEALANGRLTARGDGVGPLDEAARERATTPDALALAAVLAQRWVDVVLSGAATVPMLRSNLAALEVRWDATLDERLAGLAEPADEYWERRAALPWN
jgi:aryl-alcohol dehydrogenase-like predicted oxidoreductase